VVADHQEYFGMLNLNAASDLDQINVLESIIDDLPPEHPLRRLSGQIYYEAGRMKDLYSTMKSEDWSSDYIRQKIRDYLDDLPTRDEYIYKRKSGEFQKGDVKINDIRKEEDRMEYLSAAAELFDTFNQRMRQAQLYTFDDMINWCIQLFEENPGILSGYQEQYQYILADEFQDTNGSQLHVMNLLTAHLEAPNLFAVGDDDQSIYRFQGASMENIETFRERFGDKLSQIMLTQNYRSTQPVLNASMQVIAHNESRIVDGDEKKLTAALPARKDAETAIRVTELPNPHQEVVFVGEEIRKLIDGGVEADEIAVLYRNHAQSDALISYLNEKEIPLQLVRRYDLFSTPLFGKINRILQYVQAELDEPYANDGILFEILHFDFFGLSPNVIADLYFQSRFRRDDRKISSLRHLAMNPVLVNYDDRPAIYQQQVEQVLQVVQMLEELMQELQNQPLIQFLTILYQKCHILEHLAHSTDRLGELQELHSFHSFMEEKCKANASFSIQDLQDILRQMRDYKLSQQVQRSIADGKGVKLSTIQSAKGLEFEHVFLIGGNKNKWEGKRGNNRGYALPDNLFSTRYGKDEEEERRIFYVALTRAKTHLSVSYVSMDEEEKALEPSRFVSEMKESEGVEFLKPQPEKDSLEQYLTSILHVPKQLQLDYEESYVNRVLKDYHLSVTALNTYLKCPVEFYYTRILKVPGSQSTAAVYGSAIHYALELFYKTYSEAQPQDPQIIQNEELVEPDLFSEEEVKPPALPQVEDLLAWFEEHLGRHKYLMTDKEFELKLAAGRQNLPIYYERVLKDSIKNVMTETRINAVYASVPLTGITDKLEITPLGIRGVDYKTGKYESSKKSGYFREPYAPDKLKPNELDHQKIYGGNYWRQAIFYKILTEHTEDERFAGSLIDIRFEYVDQDDKGEINIHPIEATEESLEIVGRQIRETYEKIQQKEFTTGCDNPDCVWCRL
jgi:DNA helicase-2/ATP-dependent DNA helicase PcrA